MSFIPKNATKILQNKELLRNYAMKPKGYDIPNYCHFPKKHPEYKFIDFKLHLNRPGKQVSANTLTFRVKQDMSKPELKQYIEKLYNCEVQKINTSRFIGKVYRDMFRKIKVKKNFKKAFVIFPNSVPESLNQPL